MLCESATPATRPGGLGAPWTPLSIGNISRPGLRPRTPYTGQVFRMAGPGALPLEPLRELVTSQRSAGASPLDPFVGCLLPNVMPGLRCENPLRRGRPVDVVPRLCPPDPFAARLPPNAMPELGRGNPGCQLALETPTILTGEFGVDRLGSEFLGAASRMMAGSGPVTLGGAARGSSRLPRGCRR